MEEQATNWLVEAEDVIGALDVTGVNIEAYTITAGLLAIAQQLARVADALEKFQADDQFGRIAQAVDWMAQGPSAR